MRRNALSSHPALAPDIVRIEEDGKIVRFRVGGLRVTAGCVLAALAAAAGGCAGGSAYATNASGGGGGGTNCVVALAPANPETIGINLTNPNQAACNDSTYQNVKGYFGGSAVTASQVVGLTQSSTNVVAFVNLDFQPHTAASLGTWSGSYPSAGPNPAATASPKNTDISAPGFTTGNLDPNATSKNYFAAVPGVYVIGCAYHYTSDEMRTIIIVQ